MPRGYKRAPVYDESKGTVHIWAGHSGAPKALVELFGSDVRRDIVAHSDSSGNRDPEAPKRVDFYVVNRLPTLGDIRMGHRLGCDYGAIDLPAQHGWLADKIAAAVDHGADISIWVG